MQKIRNETIPYVGSSLWMNAKETAASPWWRRLQAQFKGFTADGKQNLYGFILAGADGTVYATRDNVNIGDNHWTTSWDDIFKAGMARFKARPPAHIELSPADLASMTYGVAPDRDASYVRVYNRMAGDRGWKRWINRDPAPGVMHLVIFKNEVEQLLALKPNPDGTVQLPPVILARIAAVHLSDNQTGSGVSWAADEIKQCDFTARLIKEEGETRTFGIEGQFAMETNDSVKHGVSGHLIGEFVVNRRTVRVEKFRGYFDGIEKVCQRKFEMITPQRAESIDLNLTRGPSPLRIAFIETNDELAYHVALGHRPPVLNYMRPEMTEAWQKRYGRLP